MPAMRTRPRLHSAPGCWPNWVGRWPCPARTTDTETRRGMTMRFKDQLCIVTGAASGIGRATAQRFAAEGALLVLVDRNEAELANVVADLPRARDHSVAVLDIADQ